MSTSRQRVGRESRVVTPSSSSTSSSSSAFSANAVLTASKVVIPKSRLSTIPCSTSPSSVVVVVGETQRTAARGGENQHRPGFTLRSIPPRQTSSDVAHPTVPPPCRRADLLTSPPSRVRQSRSVESSYTGTETETETEAGRNINCWSADTTPVKNDKSPFSILTGGGVGAISGGNARRRSSERRSNVTFRDSARSTRSASISPRGLTESLLRRAKEVVIGGGGTDRDHTGTADFVDERDLPHGKLSHSRAIEHLSLSRSTGRSKRSSSSRIISVDYHHDTTITTGGQRHSIKSTKSLQTIRSARSEPSSSGPSKGRRPSLPLSFIVTPHSSQIDPPISPSRPTKTCAEVISGPILLTELEQRRLASVTGFESMSIRSERLSGRNVGEENQDEERRELGTKRSAITRANFGPSEISPPPIPITTPSQRMRALATATPDSTRHKQRSPIPQTTIATSRSRKISGHQHKRGGSGSSSKKNRAVKAEEMQRMVGQASARIDASYHGGAPIVPRAMAPTTERIPAIHGRTIALQEKHLLSGQTANNIPAAAPPKIDASQVRSRARGSTITSHPESSVNPSFDPTEVFGKPPVGGFRNSISSHAPAATKSLGRTAGKAVASGMSREESNAMEAKALGGKTLASLYLVSGLTKDVKTWSMSDTEAMRRVQPAEDSLGCFWRPEVLGKSWAGQANAATSDHRSPPPSAGPKSSIVSSMSQSPDVSTPAMMRVMTKALKMSYTKEVEIINAELAPQAITYPFSFFLPRDSAPTRLPLSRNGQRGDDANAYGSSAGENTQWYGVCLTVWTQADPERSNKLKLLKGKLKTLVDAGSSIYGFDNGIMLGTGSTATITPLARMSQASLALAPRARSHRSSNLRIGIISGYSSAGGGDDSDSVMSESDLEGPFGPNARNPVSRSRLHRSFVADVAEEMAGDAGALFQRGEERFWIPYALTLVSRHPVFDIMGDFLKLSWARFSKDFTSHTRQISRILSYPAPRAGQSIRLLTGLSGEDDVELCGEMPGGGTGPSMSMQAWLVFAILPVDSVLTLLEVAMSNNGKVVVFSKCANAVGHFVIALQGILKPYRWSGIMMPLLHARDVTMFLDAPAPYLIGLHVDCKDVVGLPSDAVCLDLDTHRFTLPSPLSEGVISEGPYREKYRSYMVAAMGRDDMPDYGIPPELKFAYFNGKMRPMSRLNTGHKRPAIIGDDVRVPPWWNGLAMRQALDRIVLEKSKRPGFFKKLLASGPPKPEAPLTIGEISAKESMRQRAMAAVESRDLVELKIGRINRRLIHLVQEGEVWQKRFTAFDIFTEKLGAEALELKTKIEKEKREAKRLSGMVSTKQQENTELQDRLRNTERAREEALLRLSDMAVSLQALEIERDTIVDTFEHQLDNVMINLEDDVRSAHGSDAEGDGEDSGGHGPLGGGRQGGFAAQTIPKGRSGAALGVIDAMEEQAGTNKRFSLVTMDVGDDLRTLDAKTSAKSEMISDRLAKIQCKLDAALEAVSSHRIRSAEDHSSPLDHPTETELGISAEPRSAGVDANGKEDWPQSVIQMSGPHGAGGRQAAELYDGPQMPASLSSRTLVEVPITIPAVEKKIHRVGSQSVFATITTVITMDGHVSTAEQSDVDDRKTAAATSIGVSGRSRSMAADPRVRSKAAKASSRVSLLPPAGSGDYAAMAEIAQVELEEDLEYLDSEDPSDARRRRDSDAHSKVSLEHYRLDSKNVIPMSSSTGGSDA